MALPELIQITREELREWIPEFRKWAKACEENGKDELARKAYIVAHLMAVEHAALQPPRPDEYVSSFFRKSVEPEL